MDQEDLLVTQKGQKEESRDNEQKDGKGQGHLPSEREGELRPEAITSALFAKFPEEQRLADKPVFFGIDQIIFQHEHND
ncbi:MAG: hypothetical protein K9K79_09560 [Desulfohalobiaceae bacterium]|nr:hypothetical protein [Desulfohalobiaceae bacterium]